MSAVLPVLFEGNVGGVHIALQAYTTLLAAGLIAGVALALAGAHSRQLPLARSAAVFALAVLAVPLGGRLLHVATFQSLFREDPAAALDTGVTGLALFGGLTAAVVVAAVSAMALRVNLWRLADAAAPGIALGIALAKTGCFCAGCCHGVVTGGPLGVVFPLGSPAHGAQLFADVAGLLGPVQPVLPVQLFEAGVALAIGIVTWVLGRRAPSGIAFLVTAAGFSAARLSLHPMRWIEDGFGAPAWLYPAAYVAIVVACIALGLWRARVAASERAGLSLLQSTGAANAGVGAGVAELLES